MRNLPESQTGFHRQLHCAAPVFSSTIISAAPVLAVPKPFTKHQKEAREGVQPKMRRAKTKTPNQRIPLIRIHICLCCRTPASDTTRQGRTKPMNPFRGTPAPSCRTRLGKPETVADMIVPKPFKKHQKEARQGVQPKIRRAKTITPQKNPNSKVSYQLCVESGSAFGS